MSSSTPSIRISQHQRYNSPPGYTSSDFVPVVSPMAIPRQQDHVPPPLPPPNHIPELHAGLDPGWQWGNDPSNSTFGRSASVKPGSSLLGGSSWDKELLPHHASQNMRRGSSMSSAATVTLSREGDMADDFVTHGDDESTSSRRSSIYRLQSETQLEQRTLEASSNTYDSQLLRRIGNPSTSKRLSVSYAAGVQKTAQLAHAETERRNGQLRPLSMPERRNTMADSPGHSRWPSSGTVSPGGMGFWAEQSSLETSRTPATRHGSVAFDDSFSHRGSYDLSMYNHDSLTDDPQIRNLNLHDRSPSGSEDLLEEPRAGAKRRASSPPREGSRGERSSLSSASGTSEIYHRRSTQHLPNRGSPISRHHPSHSSVSSASSIAPRHGSLGSSLGMSSIPSSATSYGSGRLSPGARSPIAESAICGVPQPVASGSTKQHLSDTSPLTPKTADSASQLQQGNMSHSPGGHLCECCPKKPRKFNTSDELRQHEAEKQYTCAYCPNRFKNKNEAERHQNSLHLRLHSWSCAALAGVEAAFHCSNVANSADTCGYCGEEYSNPPQWDIRAEHLNLLHKFGECNQAKKFFRADHFRQHLKHSHAGTSGKWTNMLETACMKDEPPPEKRVIPSIMVMAGGHAPPALMVNTMGLNEDAIRAGHEAIPE